MNNLDPRKLSKEELRRHKKEGAAKIRDQQPNRRSDDLRLKDAIETHSKEQFEFMQMWVSNNIQYLRTCIYHLAVFATDDLSQAMMAALQTRLDQLENDFESAKIPKNQGHAALPFDQTILLHNRHVMLPIIGQIIPLKQEINCFAKKFFQIQIN